MTGEEIGDVEEDVFISVHRVYDTLLEAMEVGISTRVELNENVLHFGRKISIMASHLMMCEFVDHRTYEANAGSNWISVFRRRRVDITRCEW